MPTDHEAWERIRGLDARISRAERDVELLAARTRKNLQEIRQGLGAYRFVPQDFGVVPPGDSSIVITVRGCAGSLTARKPLSGVSVSLPPWSGVTDAAGQVTLYPNAGTYTYTLSKPGRRPNQTGTQGVTLGANTATIDYTSVDSAYSCTTYCGDPFKKTSLKLTDGQFGDVTLTYGSYTDNLWADGPNNYASRSWTGWKGEKAVYVQTNDGGFPPSLPYFANATLLYMLQPSTNYTSPTSQDLLTVWYYRTDFWSGEEYPVDDTINTANRRRRWASVTLTPDCAAFSLSGTLTDLGNALGYQTPNPTSPWTGGTTSITIVEI